MTARMARSFPLFLALTFALAGCSPLRAAPAGAVPPRSASQLGARGVAPSTVEGPLTACRVLRATHALAQQLDPHAAFTTLVGTHIGSDGLPGAEGGWQAYYQGTEPVGQAARRPGSQPVYRHVTITIEAQGRVRLEVLEHPGLPLGQAFFDRPMPELDSQAAIAHARVMRPTHPLVGEFQLTLTGMMSAAHFQELVWKIQAPQSAGFSAPVVFNASTGEPLKR